MSAPRPDAAPPRPGPGRAARLAAGLGAGFGAGLLGTAWHAHAWFLPGLTLPWGAGVALLLLACVELFVGLWARSAWIVVLCGSAAYLCAGLLSMPLGGFGLISANLQGNVWLYGIAFLTAGMAWWASVLVRRSR